MTEEKKLKKKLVMKRNHKHALLYIQLGHFHSDKFIKLLAAPEILPAPPKKKTKEEEDNELWSAKLGMIRNKLDGRKHRAKDRWNRFATTSGSGGHGR